MACPGVCVVVVVSPCVRVSVAFVLAAGRVVVGAECCFVTNRVCRG